MGGYTATFDSSIVTDDRNSLDLPGSRNSQPTLSSKVKLVAPSSGGTGLNQKGVDSGRNACLQPARTLANSMASSTNTKRQLVSEQHTSSSFLPNGEKCSVYMVLM